MGGRGASSGISEGGRKYGTQYRAVRDERGKPVVLGNVKFVLRNPDAKEQLLETMTRGRVYAEVTKDGQISNVYYYDNENKRVKQINLLHHHEGMQPHTHHGYYSKEYESSAAKATRLSEDERRLLADILDFWDNHRKV